MCLLKMKTIGNSKTTATKNQKWHEWKSAMPYLNDKRNESINIGNEPGACLKWGKLLHQKVRF